MHQSKAHLSQDSEKVSVQSKKEQVISNELLSTRRQRAFVAGHGIAVAAF